MKRSTFISRKSLMLGGLLTLAIAAPALAVGVASHPSVVAPYVEFLRGEAPTAAPTQQVTVWDGADLDGDGAADISNPTGQAPRGHDDFGDGYFGASRDGGERAHAGVDYMAQAGQTVRAPISGFVSKVGYAYADDANLRFVEITNPALGITARTFYIDPKVEVGQAVHLGWPIGTAQDLQPRYAGITEHVHLEIDRAGRKLDAATLLHARLETVPLMAATVSRTAAGD
ncbi:MAG: hypothetical protein BGN86_02715 [Caulobacterales bacterium 68-7]|nr:MAG: hypothetical protein BGN86_02715 [Caulobacterales bacterium 68-7]